MTAEMKMTPEELADLTEEERAGYLESLAEEGEEEGEGSAGDDASGSAEKPENDAGADAAKATEDAAADETTAGSDDAADDERRPVTVPLLKTQEAPPDLDTKLADIKSRRADLAQKFDDGELSAKEYNTQMEALADEADALKEARFKADLAREMSEQQDQQRWADTVSEFVADHPEIGRNELTWTSFDMVVRKVTGDAANASLSYAKQLSKAHAIWSEQLGIAPVKSEAGTKAQAQQRPVEREERRVPKTLAHVPASDLTETDNGKFAALDRLAEKDPDAFEARLARMSDAERDEYERGVG